MTSHLPKQPQNVQVKITKYWWSAKLPFLYTQWKYIGSTMWFLLCFILFILIIVLPIFILVRHRSYSIGSHLLVANVYWAKLIMCQSLRKRCVCFSPCNSQNNPVGYVQLHAHFTKEATKKVLEMPCWCSQS